MGWRKGFIIFIGGVVLLLGLEFLGFTNINQKYSTTAIVYVTKKEAVENNKYFIYFNVGGSQKRVKINVPEKNIWNLIKENQGYFVTYEGKGDGIPTLTKIDYEKVTG